MAFITKGGLVYSQNLECDFSDTGKCYIKVVYKKPQIILQKKWESSDLNANTQIPLLADMDGDCIPEFILRGFNSWRWC